MLACFNRPGKARNYNNPVREGSGLSLAFQRQEFSDVPYFQMLHAQGESEAGCFNSFSEGGGSHVEALHRHRIHERRFFWDLTYPLLNVEDVDVSETYL